MVVHLTVHLSLSCRERGFTLRTRITGRPKVILRYRSWGTTWVLFYVFGKNPYGCVRSLRDQKELLGQIIDILPWKTKPDPTHGRIRQQEGGILSPCASHLHEKLCWETYIVKVLSGTEKEGRPRTGDTDMEYWCFRGILEPLVVESGGRPWRSWKWTTKETGWIRQSYQDRL